METIFLQNSRLKVGTEKGQIIIRDLEQKVVGRHPVVPLERIAVYGNPQITTQTVKKCMEEGIEILYFTQYGKFLGGLYPEDSPNTERRLSQYELVRDRERSLIWSKSLIAGKIKGCEVEYRRITDNGWHAKNKKMLKQLRKYRKEVKDVQSLEELRGKEGMASRIWYNFFGESLPDGWKWNGREYHPPQDEVNALLSLYYGIAKGELNSLIRRNGLDGQLSFMHRSGYGSGGLASDLIEMLRITECSHNVLKLLYEKKVTKKDFLIQRGKHVMLTEIGWGKVIKEIGEKIEEKIRTKGENLVKEMIRYLKDCRNVPDMEGMQLWR